MPDMALVCTNALFIIMNSRITGNDDMNAAAIKNGMSIDACDAVALSIMIAT